MTEEEYYQKNKEKIDFNDISTWKYFPVGDSMRKTYDYYFGPLKHFLDTYYKECSSQKQWTEQWMNTIVFPAFENDLEKLSKSIGLGIYNHFSHKKMSDFYSEIKDLPLFDNDIKLFISWMCGMGFFEKQNISFENWISSKNFNIGGRHQVKEDLYSLQDMAKEKYGNNLVRDKLMSLEWHKR